MNCKNIFKKKIFLNRRLLWDHPFKSGLAWKPCATLIKKCLIWGVGGLLIHLCNSEFSDFKKWYRMLQSSEFLLDGSYYICIYIFHIIPKSLFFFTAKFKMGMYKLIHMIILRPNFLFVDNFLFYSFHMWYKLYLEKLLTSTICKWCIPMNHTEKCNIKWESTENKILLCINRLLSKINLT